MASFNYEGTKEAKWCIHGNDVADQTELLSGLDDGVSKTVTKDWSRWLFLQMWKHQQNSRNGKSQEQNQKVRLKRFPQNKRNS